MPATDSRRRTLRARLGIAFAVATLVPALAIVALHAALAARQARTDADATLQRSVMQLHARVESHLDQRVRGVANLAEALAASPLRPIPGQPEPAGLAGWLDRQAAGRPAFESLFVVDAAGRVAAVSPSDGTAGVATRRQAIADRDYVREPMRNGQPFLSGLFVPPGTGTPVLVAAAPIPGPSGQPGGVVGGVLRLSAFDAMVRDHRVASAAVQVLDPSGFQVATTDAGDAPPRSPARAAALAPLVVASRPTDGTPSWHVAPSGEAHLAAVLASPRGWRTAVVLPRRAVYAAAWQSTVTALLAVGGGLVLAAAVAGALARRALRPLEILVAAAEELAEGHELAPVAGGAPDEVARLTADFSRLAARATAIRATLEQDVVARTAELSEARDRAEREARLKSVFLAAMSHEIRTPMNSIVGMAELMAETPLDGEQREYCDTIRTSTDALLGVINDILDFSRFEAQGVTLETVDFDLRVVVEDAVDLLAVKAATVGLDLAAVVEPGFDGRFRGDPSRLRQVVVNLLGNAIKFTARGSVVIRVATVGGSPDGAVRIAVTDTGIGMTPEGLSRLFRPFSQAEASIVREYGGSGLGLTISKQIVERMGGVIGVESAPGRGSTFWAEIPFPRGTALPAAPRPAHRFADALILEPREASAEALQRLLIDVGIRPTRVATAGDGLTALDAAGAAGPAGFALAFVSVDAIDAAPFVDALEQHASSAGTVLVAIVPTGRRAGTELDRFGSAPRLTRPLRRARLVEGLDAIAAGPRPAAAAVTPLAPTPVAATASAAEPAGAARILVADDYFANQRLVTRLLERRGYLVEAVGDGQAAVDAVLARRFDVVLMDCNMPGLDGYAATAQIRALERDRRTPILAMTANDSPDDREICLRGGMDDYLVKPIQAVKVLAAIERWVAVARQPIAPAAAGPGAAR